MQVNCMCAPCMAIGCVAIACVFNMVWYHAWLFHAWHVIIITQDMYTFSLVYFTVVTGYDLHNSHSMYSVVLMMCLYKQLSFKEFSRQQAKGKEGKFSPRPLKETLYGTAQL